MMTMLTKSLSVLLFTAAVTATPAAAAEIKVGSVSSQQILQSPTFRATRDKFASEFEKRKQNLENDLKKFEEDAKKYSRDKDIMAPDERAKKEKDLTSRQVDLQYAQQKFNEDAQARDRELTQDVMSKVKEAIMQVAKDKSLDLVVQDPVFAVPALDITDDVIKILQAAAPAGAATSAKSKKEGK